MAAFQQEKRELLKRPLGILLERWKNRDANAERIRAEEYSAAGGSGEAVSQETTTDHFRGSVLEHILCPETFLQSHLGNGLFPLASSPSVSPSSCSATQTGRSDPAPSSRSGFLSPSSSTFAGSLVEQTPKRKKKGKTSASGDDCYSKDIADAVEQTRIKQEKTTLSGDCPQTDVDDVVCQLLEMHWCASAEYVKYHRLLLKDLRNEDKLREARASQHRSYKWLLKVLSRLTHCPETDIELMVWEVEQSVTEKLNE